ncbi:hypothetical protein [Thermoflavifilum thermophilum]|nr:hypothetical protein [Thermoflavifilum thermophilum]
MANCSSFWSYLESYKSAFEVLMDKVYQSGFHVDTLAIPILFIVRHCMELGFKANIRYFIKYSEKNDFKEARTHNLEKLYVAFKQHILDTIKNLKDKYRIEVEKTDIEELNKYFDEVNKLINTFYLLDKNSYGFRYPFVKKNNILIDDKETINLLDVKDLFEKSMLLLTHTADVFAKYTDFADEIETMYEEEMRANYGY